MVVEPPFPPATSDLSPNRPPPAPGPLSGLRVLDLGIMIAGPMVSTLLADFGADVIKLELPGQGDPMRGVGTRVKGESLAWLIAGRNKRSATLDVRHPRGRQPFLRLVEDADVLVESFRPGTMEAWDLGEDALRAVNDRLVFVRISGFGQTGHYADRPGFDGVALAYGGVTFITGYPDCPPSRVGVPVADYSTAYSGALAVMIALYHRDWHGGPGQTIDLSLFETVFGMTRELVTEYELTGHVRYRRGNSNPQISPGGAYRTSDQAWVMVAGSTDKTFVNLMRAIDRPDLAEDPRFRLNTDRIANDEVLDRVVTEWIAANTADVVLKALSEAGVPANLVYSAADIAADSHYADRQALIEVEHPVLGSIRIPGVPTRLSHTPGSVRTLGPEVGQHTDEVFEEVGFSPAQIAEWREAGVV